MNEHEAQRFLNEQRYQNELPFPVSAVFTHYVHSSTKNYALRSLQLVATAQSAIRYAAIVAACDYATNPDADETVLNFLRQEWFGGRKPSFGTWYSALMRLLAESGKSWRNPFVPEFSDIDHELLEKKIQPLIHGRNVEIGHAEYYEALAMKHFVELQEENLFAVMEQLSFLTRYPLAFVEIEEDYETPPPGTKQAVNVCRGASHNFSRYTVTPSQPLSPGIPFIWNSQYTGILTLSPFLIYGRATTDAEQKEKVKGIAHIQGLMVMNGVQKASPVYTSVDAEAQFSLDSFEFPPKEHIQTQVEKALKKGLNVPNRIEVRLAEDEKELFVRTSDYVEPTYEKEGAHPSKRKPRFNTALVSGIIGVLVLIACFALYSRFIAHKAPLKEKSIAVLPFVNMSNDPEQESFCNGITEEIINRLAAIDSLKVIARTSAFSFKGKNATIGEIGKTLNVNTVLEGSVRKAGDQLRITAQLIKVQDGSHLWSKTFKRKTSDIFDIQDEISTTIAEIMKGTLKEEERLALERNYTKNPEVYDLYLQGLKENNDYEKKIKYFEMAIKKDPKFVPAYIELSYLSHRIYVNNHYQEYEMKAKMNIEKALKIDKNNADAHAMKGFILFQVDWNFAAADSEFKLALSLNPGSAYVHGGYSNYLKIMRRFDECISELNKSLDIDPLDRESYKEIIWTYRGWGKYDEAEKIYRKAKELFPDYIDLDFQMAGSYINQGRYKEAVEKWSQVFIPSSNDVFLGYFYGLKGEKDKARQILNRMIEKASKEYIPPVNIALIYNGLGENDNVFIWLEKAYEKRDYILLYINPWPEFQNLRSDPRFNKLLKKIGFPEK